MIDRQAIVKHFKFSDDTQKADLLNPSMTQDNLLLMLQIIAGQGWTPLVTSVRRDHGPDPAGSVHGHEEGFAIDLWVEPPQMAKFIHDCIYANEHVTKIGFGGAAQLAKNNGVGDHTSSNEDTAVNGTVLFADNSSDHIHLQTA